MPSEAEIGAAEDAILRSGRTVDAGIARIALSAAEKEREGGKLPATQEGREGEAVTMTLEEYEAQREAREGGVIEQLREWVRDQVREDDGMADQFDVGYATAISSLDKFLDYLAGESDTVE